MITLPMQPPEATPIGSSCFSLAVQDGRMVYFSNLEPYDFHAVEDRDAFLLRLARFAEMGITSRTDLLEAFDVGRATLQRALQRFRRDGEAGFFTPRPRKARGPSVLVDERRVEAELLLASGKSVKATALSMGVSPATMYSNIRKGFIVNAAAEARKARREASEPPVAEAAPVLEGLTEASEEASSEAPEYLDRAARDTRDREAPMGRGARDQAGRVAASRGMLAEREPGFPEALTSVPCGGVLAALPMLLREGLLARVREFLSLPKGYYGMSSILLLLAFLFLARVRSAEALRRMAPGEMGALLGLDRCPEVKTLRRKIRALAANEQALREWQQALAADWLAETECPTLLVDGHVKVYSGRKGRLPKHFVSRQRLCLPATTSYWVNALGGRPLLCLYKNLDPTLTHALVWDILPELAKLGLPGPNAPDLIADRTAEPRLTLVFDREGWSPTLFENLAQRGIAVITWHKGRRQEPWPEDEFKLATVPIHGPGGRGSREVRLAEKRISLTNGLEVRQIRCLVESGRQMPLVTTDFGVPLEQIAGMLMSRWSQENFFKYMREEFNLDAMPVHDLAEQDPEAKVINPAWRELDRSIRNLRKKLGDRRNWIGTCAAPWSGEKPTGEAAGVQGKLCNAWRPSRRTREHQVPAPGDAQAHPRRTPRGREARCPARPREAPPRPHPDDRLPHRDPDDARRRRGPGHEPATTEDPRRALPDEADILPDPDNNILRVCIRGTAANARPTTPSVDCSRNSTTRTPCTPEQASASSTNCHQTETRAPGKMVPPYLNRIPAEVRSSEKVKRARCSGLRVPPGQGSSLLWPDARANKAGATPSRRPAHSPVCIPSGKDIPEPAGPRGPGAQARMPNSA